ncbi:MULTISPECIES: aspartate aminotransferase family protein [unclassified Streptomyces]|uniref:aspartate aminotransferase family protein n=1 Tax=unclassified Streptomyces TaxID=2593676 RepID=UPI0007494A82|nr:MULTISPECIES: aminotransferase class III-fold pyridoxal phosphate-dependent enzyme [unclassified Streptomyces]KUL62386.1 4-aminobutyrate aminotransferase [Streptomyces sp. NRRL S-1521]THC44779.1 aminotransferase class III-fold pyridoxal phosphate-dependent enzyme [Streptomyces sp. A1499]
MARLSPVLKPATPVTVSHARGLDVYGDDGRRYLDFTAGIGVTSTGHCHPAVVSAIAGQAERLLHGQYVTVRHRPLLDLCDRLGQVLPAELQSLFFANSGSEAVEAALRLARQATGRPNVIVFHGGFHGRTVGAASMTTSSPRFRTGYAPLMAGVHIAPFPSAYRYGWSEDEATRFALQELDFLLATVTAPEDTAALVVEPVLGEGGFVPAPAAFAQGLRERADHHGFCLVMDEVQTGFGRTGRFWGHQHLGVEPDILVAAKGLTSGLPLSVMAASEKLMSMAPAGSQGGTYGGNAVACAAALATLEVIAEEELVANAAAQGLRLAQGLRRIAEDHAVPGDIRGLGLMLGWEFSEPDGRPDAARALRVQQEAIAAGLLLQIGGPMRNVLRLLPALVVDEAQVDRAVGALSRAVASAAGSTRADRTKEHA